MAIAAARSFRPGDAAIVTSVYRRRRPIGIRRGSELRKFLVSERRGNARVFDARLATARETQRVAIDSGSWRDYIGPMAENINATFERELKRLENRVDALVRVCDQLQDENRSLKQRQDTLTAERATLLQKNEQVRARVEAMIGRLKAMEQGS